MRNFIAALCASAALLAGAPVSASAPAADFTLASLKDGNLKLSEQRGDVIMLNFWASWCGPCREEMPLLNDLHARYESVGFKVWGVNVDANREDAQAMLNKIPVEFPVLFDAESSVSRLFGVEAMPSSVFIDRDGKVRYVHKGYRSGDEAEYKKIIKELIRE
ncbi:TlpA disulfide reductase family protein [Microbulbifer harenosus]|uniref:TlpA family protein disulfide reductase n=1 Tax=Microbulbifer harenosus TaxID=2576840 RepID=A0ABY2ULX7_9GAMM|nr:MULTISPECIES: TlpA disulfide reductase family protein [Microbulbifer]QIL90930.1 redoxin domain-containing protein [Microbulbifer sp. SH-1]TLM79148.1 TlpA family protein disulfide reductase [Microbulbifer harenosus]